jgi:hypothetical protein
MTVMKQLEYRPVGARLRAPRFVLAYRPMADWVYMARCALTQVSRVWGGSGAVILPVSGETEDATAHSGLLPLLRNYDPDHVAGLLPTVADAAHMNPTVRDRMVAQYATPDEGSDRTWHRLSSLPLQMPRWEGLAGQLDGWCSPFKGVRQNKQHFEAHDVRNLGQTHESRGSLATVSVPPYDRMFTLDLSGVEPTIALMVETRLGSADRAARPDENIMELPVEDEDLPALMGSREPLPHGCRRGLAAGADRRRVPGGHALRARRALDDAAVFLSSRPRRLHGGRDRRGSCSGDAL